MLISPAEMAEDRAMAEAEMVDRCRVTRPALPTDPGYVRTFNDATGQYTEPADVVVYEGRCRVQVRSDINSNAVEAVVADHEWTYRTATMQFPMTANPAKGDVGDPADIKSDYTAEIVESPLDPTRVGSRMNLQADTKAKTQASHRRFRIRELLS